MLADLQQQQHESTKAAANNETKQLKQQVDELRAKLSEGELPGTAITMPEQDLSGRSHGQEQWPAVHHSELETREAQPNLHADGGRAEAFDSGADDSEYGSTCLSDTASADYGTTVHIQHLLIETPECERHRLLNRVADIFVTSSAPVVYNAATASKVSAQMVTAFFETWHPTIKADPASGSICPKLLHGVAVLVQDLWSSPGQGPP
ncbi:unnamed protein product [Prorocentrum cordatum]|uniref:Uncharacterized protein n=1 Tax=Prorocentrum cordatum TaxID=2364126 RepID=A0ABN9SJ97_9DINO|nr:unnamed protein product [Polarella glacialis]